MKQSSYVVLIGVLLFFYSCTRTETSPAIKSPNLSIDNVSSEEVWLKFDKGGETGTVKVLIKRDDNKLINFTLAGQDTIICDDSLKPGTNYSYQSFILSEYLPKTAPKVVPARTLDTTSHDFTWQVYTFGVPGTSILSDIAINSENDIWAVGDYYLLDSLGKIDPYRYNATRWNGENWENKRITDVSETGPSCADFFAVFILPDGIKLFSSGSPYLQEQNYWRLFQLWNMGVLKNTNGGIYKIWGTSLNDIYFVGLWGSIVYLDGIKWQRIDLSEKYDFADVWGVINPLTNSSEVFCAGSDFGDPPVYDPVFRKAKLVKISKGTKVDTIPWNGTPLFTLWTNDGKIFYAGGGDIYTNKKGGWEKVRFGGTESIMRVRGNGLNDIFAVGTSGKVSHFNGKTWKDYTGFGGMYLTSVAVKGNIVAAVGSNANLQGVVIIGRRN